MKFWNRHWWIVRLWRIVVLLLSFVLLVLGAALWVLTGNLSKSMMYGLFYIMSTAYAVHILFSVNIFRRRMRKLQPRSGRLFVLMSALGLYMLAVGAIFFATAFLLLQVMQMPRTIVLATVGGELALFSVVGYIILIRLRRNMGGLCASH